LLTIIKLQNPQLITSYALPPQTLFGSAPCSLYFKGTSKKPSRRYTYAFVAQRTPSFKPALVCFAEQVKKDSTTDTIKTSYSPSDATQKLLSIEVIPTPARGSQQDDSHEVLAIFEGGDVICLSSDLEIVRWVANLRSLASPSKNIELVKHVSLNSAKAVTHGLLKNRQDVSVLLNPSLDEKSDLLAITHVICVIFQRSGNRKMLSLFQMQSRSPDLATSRLLPVKHLLDWDVPIPQSVASPDVTAESFTLHASSGALYILTGGRLQSYDFSGTIPKFCSDFGLSIESVLRISQDLLFATSQGSCRVLDAKYKSVLAERFLAHNVQSPIKETRKRKHSEPVPGDAVSGSPVLITFYADIGLAVGLYDHEIIGFQLEGSMRRKRMRVEGTRLIDSLGKGISLNSESRDYLEQDNHERTKWQEKMVRLDKYAAQGRIARYEETFATDLGIELEPESNVTEEQYTAASKRVKESQGPALTNGTNEHLSATSKPAVAKTGGNDAEAVPRKWNLSKVDSVRKLSRQGKYALYALSRIFQWTEGPSSQSRSGYLKIEFFPPNVFQWLLHCGYLTKESIRRAILDDPATSLNISTTIHDGDIVRAVVSFDPELHILSAILNHGQFLPIGEVVQAIRFLVQSLDDQPKSEQKAKLLTNGTGPEADAMDVDIACELEAASNEIDRAQAMLDNGLTIRNNTLRPALVRLHTFPAALISSTLRSMLPRHDLESLIRLLHHEFKNGGWTAPYDIGDIELSEPDTSLEQIDDSAVAIIASLLSCTLDAIGPAIWLTSVGESSTGELVADLLDDTSIALNGFWEATYIRGLLGELLRFASKVSKSQKPSSITLEKQNKPFAVEPDADELPMLPLGAKPDLGIEKTKTGRGGRRRERSAREIGHLISKRVGKYSFERIVM